MAGPIRLGVAPIAWSNSDLPQLGGATSLETCLKESRKAGFSGTETGVKFPMNAKVLRPKLEAHRLKLVSGWFSGELLKRSVAAEKDRILAQMETFKALGAPVLVYAETTGTVQNRIDVGLSKRPRLAAADFPAYGRKLTQLAEWMADFGVAMTYHHHMGTVIETEREVDLLMANTGAAVGLLLDSGHLTFAGGNVVETTRRHGRRINHVHCKDLRAGRCSRPPARRTRAFSPRSSTASSPCRATASSISTPSHESSTRSATRAGWWSRPSRIPRRRRPMSMRLWAAAT